MVVFARGLCFDCSLSSVGTVSEAGVSNLGRGQSYLRGLPIMDQRGFWTESGTSAPGETAGYRTTPPLAPENAAIAGPRIQDRSFRGWQGIPLPKRRRQNPVPYPDGGGDPDLAVGPARVPGNPRNVRHGGGLHCPDSAHF